MSQYCDHETSEKYLSVGACKEYHQHLAWIRWRRTWICEHAASGYKFQDLDHYRGLFLLVIDDEERVLVRLTSCRESLAYWKYWDVLVRRYYLCCVSYLYLWTVDGTSNSCSTADRGAVERGAPGYLRDTRKCYWTSRHCSSTPFRRSERVQAKYIDSATTQRLMRRVRDISRFDCPHWVISPHYSTKAEVS
jgi:hypothetical protein